MWFRDLSAGRMELMRLSPMAQYPLSKEAGTKQGQICLEIGNSEDRYVQRMGCHITKVPPNYSQVG